MKQKKIWLFLAIVLVIVGGVGGKWYMDKKEAKEKQLIEWQRVAAKQIKNTFADVEEVHFDGKTLDENWLSGYTGVELKILTNFGEIGYLNISLPRDEEDKTLSSYIGEDTKEGVTKGKIKVIYTDNSTEEL